MSDARVHMITEAADLVSRLGRRLRVAMIGGSLDSYIGETHRIALRIDGVWDLVAGVFSRDPQRSRVTGNALLIEPDRVYADVAQMLDAEANRADGIDAVIVATLPSSHVEIAQAVLNAGLHLICEKPLTSTDAPETADDVVAAARRSDALAVVTHCYSGYPMVRQARQMVRDGALGRILRVESNFAGGGEWLAREPATAEERHWRVAGVEGGSTAILGETGSHALHLASYVTGQRIGAVSARMSTLTERRVVVDDVDVLAEMDGGALGRFWFTYHATGALHGLSIDVYGTDAAISWKQESPELLEVRPLSAPAYTLSKGAFGSSAVELASTRFTAGHPDGYGMAFANLYREFGLAVLSQKLGEDPTPHLELLPSVEAAAHTMATIAAIQESDAGGAASTRVRGAWMEAAT